MRVGGMAARGRPRRAVVADWWAELKPGGPAPDPGMKPVGATGAPPGPSPSAVGRVKTAVARLPPSLGKRDFFPLPKVALMYGSGGPQPRRDRRVRERRRVVNSINEVVEALNWMHGSRIEDKALVVAYPLEL